MKTKSEAGKVGHTPGPWKVIAGDAAAPGLPVVVDANGLAVCRGVDPDDVATIRAIAAAPELLENAQYVESCLPTERDLSDYADDEPIELCMTVKAIKDLRAAIAKAEGR